MASCKGLKIKQDVACLIVSLIIFPISLKLALFCFVSFLILRIDLGRNEYQKLIIKIILGMAIAISTSKLCAESLSLFHPVSAYDYLLLIVTVGIIKQNLLSIKSIYQICWAISLSPIVVFICSLKSFNFNIRNHWGFGNPNWLGLYCSMCLGITLCLSVYQFRQRRFISSNQTRLKIGMAGILALIAIVISMMIVSSGSRSSLYTSLLISSIVLWRLLLPFKNSMNWLKQPKLLLYLSLLVSGAVLICQVFLRNFSFLGRFIELANSTNLYRIKLYKCHLALGMQKPIWGWGLNQATAICEQKLGAGQGGVNHAHNFILQLFVDRGLIVCLLCLRIIFCFSILSTLILIAKPSFGSANDILHLGISGSSISILTASLFQSGFYHYPLFPFWLGLLWGCQLSIVEHQDCSIAFASEKPSRNCQRVKQKSNKSQMLD